MQVSNHTQIPNIFIDNLKNFTGLETKIFLAICRKTIGWHKISDRISYSQLREITGLSIHGLKTGIEKLIKKKIIKQKLTKKGYEYDISYVMSIASVSRGDIARGDTLLYPVGIPSVSRGDTTIDTNKRNKETIKNTPCFPCKTYTRLVKNYKGNSVIKTWCKLFKPICDKDDKFCMAHCNQLYVRLQTEFKSKGLDIKSPAFFGAFRNKVNQMLGDPDSTIFKDLKNRYKKMPNFMEEIFNESNR